jgi:hypothetical protein
VAFDAKSERLAVGTYAVDQKAGFRREIDGKVIIYDLRQHPPTPTPGPKVPLYAEGLAFHPDGTHLAVAGGQDYEVTLWRLPNVQEWVSRIQSRGSSVWSVGFSKDGRYLGFRDQRNTKPMSPNEQGTGPWRTFALKERKFLKQVQDFQPVEPLQRTPDGWEVQFEPTNAGTWYVVTPDKHRFSLPWDQQGDFLPRCYTFLKATKTKPVRLAVGHYWGISIFELHPNKEPRRVRLFTGHQGEVTAVAPSADQRGLVSASRDQTIAAWSLADWPSQAELGAQFIRQENKILVSRVDPGSPAWEAGLIEGDEVAVFAFNLTEFLFDPYKNIPEPVRKLSKHVGSMKECLERLRQPVPGRQFYFKLKRRGRADLVEAGTTIRQRPLWRFFPTRDGEWVLWRWRDYYYDTSTFGDQLIGWQVGTDVDDTPTFYKAEHFRERFHKPEKVADVIEKMALAPERVPFPDIEPPDVSIKAAANVVKNANVIVNLTAVPRGKEADQQLDQVNLWINDYLFKDDWQLGPGVFRQLRFVVPRARLRRGPNTLILQCYNKAGGRGEESVTVTYESDQPVQPRLFGLAVGINDYSRAVLVSSGKRGSPNNLDSPVKDAEAIRNAWLGQKHTRFYRDANIESLFDHQATRTAILSQIAAIAKKVEPDDWMLVFLAGHGYAKRLRPDVYEPNSFVFICSNYDSTRLGETGLTCKELYLALAKVPCRKLVLLDACHSGDVVGNVIRDLSQQGVGAIIMTACATHEVARESEEHGYFTLAILEALGEKFDKADLDRNGKLDAAEIFRYVRERVQKLNEEQTPNSFPSTLERVPLAQKR